MPVAFVLQPRPPCRRKRRILRARMATTVYWKARLLFASVLCAGAAAGAAWYAWSSSRSRTYEIVTRDPVHGLIWTAPVEFHGVEVGKVTKVELIDAGTVRIRVSVADDAPVSSATVATITSRGLAARGFAGYVYVALENTGPGPSAPLLRRGSDRYPTIPSARGRVETIDSIATA